MGCWKTTFKVIFKKRNRQCIKIKNISNGWVKKSTNVLGAKTVMELRGIPCIQLDTEEAKEKAVVFHGHLEKKLKV